MDLELDLEYSVSLEKIIREFNLEVVAGAEYVSSVKVSSTDLNRPGLELTGYHKHFESARIQIIGNTEFAFLWEEMSLEKSQALIDSFFKLGFPCLVLTRGLDVLPGLVTASEQYKIPILRTKQVSTRFISALVGFLTLELAPRTSVHGVLVEVYGEGILIVGESGVGKSETAMELVKRGHRLVADDVVEIRRVSDKTLVGSSPEQIRHFLEIRGIGIVDVKNLYGMGSVKLTERIDLIINLENWKQHKEYERLGMQTQYKNILEIEVPTLLIPVRPGRNLAIIVEVAAMNNRQKEDMGYNAAEVLNDRLMQSLGEDNAEDS
ncbi:MAG: HPr(Ser) kinase/phosphatase [Clostridia bacterium]